MRVATFIGAAFVFIAAGYFLGHTATRDSAESAIRNHQNWRLRAYLLQAGSPNAATDVGSLLDFALGEKGNDDAALMLIDAGAVVERDGSRSSSLEAAMVTCRPAVVSALLRAKDTWDIETLNRASSLASCPMGRDHVLAYMASNVERTRER
jgi:hypothetical protein